MEEPRRAGAIGIPASPDTDSIGHGFGQEKFGGSEALRTEALFFGCDEGFQKEEISGAGAVTRLRLGAFNTQAHWGHIDRTVQSLMGLARGGIAAALGHFADLLKHNGIEIRRVQGEFREQHEG